MTEAQEEEQAQQPETLLPPPTEHSSPHGKQQQLSHHALETHRLQGIIQHLKREVATVRNRADIDLEEIELENQALRKTCQLRREKIDKQRTEIQKLQATLRDYQKVDSDQQRALARQANKGGQTIHKSRIEMANMQAAHDEELARIRQELSELREERAAMSMGFAAIAQYSIGGPDADPEYIAEDERDAAANNEEPIPRNPTVWGFLKYHLDDSGNLATFSHAPNSLLKPFDRDGARGIAALCAQVARLYSHRAILRTKLEQRSPSILGCRQEAMLQEEFAVVRDTLASLQKSFHQLSQAVNTHIDQEQPASRETEPDADISQLESIAHIKQTLATTAEALANARQELQALRQGPSPPPTSTRRSSRMASRLVASPIKMMPKSISAADAYKEAMHNCKAAMQKEFAARDKVFKQRIQRPVSVDVDPAFLMPVQLATRPSLPARPMTSKSTKSTHDCNGRFIAPPKGPDDDKSSSSSASDYSDDEDSEEDEGSDQEGGF